MGMIRAYIKTFSLTGGYEADFAEVTNDINMSGLGSVGRSIDNSDFDIGIFNYSSFGVSVKNDHGKYSAPPSTQSIFKVKRKGSIFKLTWEVQDFQTLCATAICGECKISPAVDLFEGIIDDDASTTDIFDQSFRFTVLGYESLFSQTQVNFSSISNGQTTSQVMYAILNQAKITDLLTVQSGNIVANVNATIDLVAAFENVTVKKALDDLLFLSNSVLYIKAGVVYVSARTEGATNDYTFYGQASNNGVENINSISDIRLGLNKTFNLWKWDGTSLFASDSTSITENGVRSRSPIKFDQITNNTTRQNILNSLNLEYRNPKQEIEIESPFTYDLLVLGVLDKVNVDYPTVFVGAQGGEIPIYGASKYGVAKYPIGQWSLTLATTTFFKIMDIRLDVKSQTATLKLREI